MRIEDYIRNLPVIQSEICDLSKKIKEFSFVKEITDLRLNGTLLEIVCLKNDGKLEIVSQNISALQGQGKYIETVENYTELSTITNPKLNQLVYVRKSQGTRWLPGSIGGSYYSAGFYIYNGENWIKSRNVTPPKVNAGEDYAETLIADGNSDNYNLKGLATPGTYPIVGWNWQITNKPTGSENIRIKDSDKQNAVFKIQRDVKNSGNYLIRVTICDTHGNCIEDNVKLNYTFTPAIPPRVELGAFVDFPIIEVSQGYLIVPLSPVSVTKGTFPIKSYLWECVSKPLRADMPRIETPTKKNRNAFINEIEKNTGDYTFRLTICDTMGRCTFNEKDIRVHFKVTLPKVDAGEDYAETLKADGVYSSHSLIGSATPGTYDIASWKWTIIAKPTGSENIRIKDSNKQNAVFKIQRDVKNSGSYGIKLRVCDTQGNCGYSDVTVTYTIR